MKFTNSALFLGCAALLVSLSASLACVKMRPSLRRNACTDERSFLTYQLVQRLGADQCKVPVLKHIDETIQQRKASVQDTSKK